MSTAGHPNYGDELITRAWLDILTELRPDAEVWLDCPHPGRASHLFRRTHPNLHVTNTLWELAHSSPSHDPISDTERIARHVRDLGTPRIDPGLLALRHVTSVHLLGGGHFNDLWQDNLGIIAAVSALHREFGISARATGLGLQPLAAERGDWLREQFSVFDHVEVRDRASADAIGSEVGLDDAFLALSVLRPVYDERPSPENVVLVQGDLRAWSDIDAIRSIDDFLADAPDNEAAFVEALPPDDARYIADTRPSARFYSFGNIWFDGLPARPGQRWLTTRFHAHLLAAAAGAAGTVIAGQEGYYDHKHASLLELGTGWTVVPAGSVAEPTVDPDFPARAREHAAAKRRLAERLYPAEHRASASPGRSPMGA
ncbi:polysaccharide pyruvyl transferase family protein [Microbacterium abyssi]|uniref:polysaccharide pyruvyl transferase family protein n=1 Tax=Microbacterium abyssi TaxID=2782166 RepID=UPI001E5B8B30|nr:polysaccharide pyruvyl transferase family protein [Microbacterium sp. A18JL241]